MIDLFITLLSMGLDGYKRILDERKRLVGVFRSNFELLAAKFGERLLNCPRNTISFGVTLDTLVLDNDDANEEEDDKLIKKKRNVQITKFGSMLFTRCISGTRVVPTGEIKSISGHTFQGFGSSHENYPYSYMTAACAVGMGEDEMKEFFNRLEKSWKEYATKRKKDNARRKLKNEQKMELSS
jgi:O-phospho-L-seryl-tRNASec:L-selenocysteinyl-tRNA synthase